jgi:phosphate acetyltransferase
MNSFFDKILEKALSKNANLLLPESKDPRIKEAKKKLKEIGILISSVDDFTEDELYYNYLLKQKFTKNWPLKQIAEYISKPINKALVLLACGEVDGVVAGATCPTSEIIRSSIRIVGIKKESKWVSSTFFMVAPCKKKVYTFADCAVIPEPNSQQIAYIATDAYKFHETITKEEAKVAFLSFSTNGSAEHFRVARIKEAAQIFSKKNPNIIASNDIQFDAAISVDISNKKNANSLVNGEANIFIFPNLDAGNIGYKIAQQLGGYSALGPLLQGINKPVHDLSRGCDVDDIINVALIAAIQKPT